MRSVKHHHVALPTIAAEFWLGTVLLTVFGCVRPAHEYDAVVTGTVTIDGELAKSGTVTFHPVAKDGKISVGRIYPDGSFSMRTGQGNLSENDGGTVPSGEYVVTVAVTAPTDASVTVGDGGPPKAGAYLMHSRYSLKETSDLQKTIAPGENVLVLALQAAEPMPLPESVQATDSTEPAPVVESTTTTDTAAPVATEEVSP